MKQCTNPYQWSLPKLSHLCYTIMHYHINNNKKEFHHCHHPKASYRQYRWEKRKMIPVSPYRPQVVRIVDVPYFKSFVVNQKWTTRKRTKIWRRLQLILRKPNYKLSRYRIKRRRGYHHPSHIAIQLFVSHPIDNMNSTRYMVPKRRMENFITIALEHQSIHPTCWMNAIVKM